MNRLTLSLASIVALNFSGIMSEANAFHLFHHSKKESDQSTEGSNQQTQQQSPTNQGQSSPPPTQQSGSANAQLKQTPASTSLLRTKSNSASKTNTVPTPQATKRAFSATPSATPGATRFPVGSTKIRTFNPETSTVVPTTDDRPRQSSPGATSTGAGDNDLTEVMTGSMTRQQGAGFSPSSPDLVPVPAAGGSTPPPDLPARPPLPTPPAVSLIPPAYKLTAKDSLEWRARAYKMQTASTARAQVIVNAGLTGTLSALKTVLPQCGFNIEEICGNAGQVCARSKDPALSRYRFIYTITEIEKDGSLVKVGVDPDSRAIKNNLMEGSLQQIQASISKAGAL